MSSEFRASTPAEASAIAELCTRVLEVPAGSPMFSPAHLQWKYWRAWPGWAAARSYVLTRAGRIVAHAAVIPLHFERLGRKHTLLHLIDWASEPSAIGSGAALLKRISALADGLLIAGGSATTQRMVKPLGFRAMGEAVCYAAGADVRAGVELGARGYEVVPLLAADAELPAPQTDADELAFERSCALLEALASCPVAAVASFGVRKAGRWLGGFSLASVPAQVRIGGCWLQPHARQEADVLLRLALRQASGIPRAAEVVSVATSAWEKTALEGAGFTACGRLPLFVLAPPSLVPEGARIRFELMDGDALYLHHGVPEPWR